VIAGVGGAAASITIAAMLPLKFMRVLTRTSLDCLKAIALRPAAGTSIDLSGLGTEELVDAVQAGSTTVADALREVMGRMSRGTATDVARLSAIQSTLANLDRMGMTMGDAGATNASGVHLGAYTFAYTQAARISRLDLSKVAAAGGADVSDSSSDKPRRELVSATIIRPASMAEFSDFLLKWLMICQACGLGHVLTLGRFLTDVVYDSMSMHGKDWQVAHELFLAYLEFVETTSDEMINITNVFARGGI
jgi:hypothetical protein